MKHFVAACMLVIGGSLTGVRAQDNPTGIAIQPINPFGSTAQRFATPTTGEVGRYQISVISDGDRGTMVMLLDTKEGATWIYRPPQGNAVNGFWSDIPRLTYAPEFWRNIFNQQPSLNEPTAPAPAPRSPQP
jgi:hypothetical protein